MERSTLLWTLVVFFGASIAFGAVRDLTDGESTAVVVLAQVALLAIIVGAIVLFVRLRERG
jgi:hypothetical protein